VWKLVRDGVLTACSIGFRALKHEPLENGGYRFTSWDWYELSIVSVPANPGARSSVAKCMAVDATALEPNRAPAPINPSPEVGRAAPRSQGAMGAIDPVDFGKAIGGVIRDSMAPLRVRIEKLESMIPVDAEGFDALAKFMERLDKLEADVADSG